MICLVTSIHLFITYNVAPVALPLFMNTSKSTTITNPMITRIRTSSTLLQGKTILAKKFSALRDPSLLPWSSSTSTPPLYPSSRSKSTTWGPKCTSPSPSWGKQATLLSPYSPFHPPRSPSCSTWATICPPTGQEGSASVAFYFASGTGVKKLYS